MPSITYPFDPTGTLPANKITNETHVLTSVNSGDFYTIVPKLGPFFETGLILEFTNQAGDKVTLVKNVDYYLSNIFLSASRACSKPLYGSATLIDTSLTGILTFKQYQSIGGEWVLDINTWTSIVANMHYNPRTTTWEQLVGTPTIFPVIDHQWNLADMVGLSEMVNAVNDVVNALLAQPTNPSLSDHLLDYTNPHHVTQTDVGLADLQNYGIATVSDLENGVSNKYVTPAPLKIYLLAVAQQIYANVSSALGDIAALRQAVNNLIGSPFNKLSATTGNRLKALADGLYIGDYSNADVATMYVNKLTGNDDNDGSISSPMATIRGALLKGDPGITRTLYLYEGQMHLVNPATPAVLRGGFLSILPYGPLSNALPNIFGDTKFMSQAGRNLNTMIQSMDFANIVNINGVNFQSGSAFYPVDGGSISVTGITMGCGKPNASGAPLSAYAGTFHDGVSTGQWYLRNCAVSFPHASSRFLSDLKIGTINVLLNAVTLAGPGKFSYASRLLKLIYIPGMIFPSLDATDAIIRSYLVGLATATVQYSNIDTNILPP